MPVISAFAFKTRRAEERVANRQREHIKLHWRKQVEAHASLTSIQALQHVKANGLRVELLDGDANACRALSQFAINTKPKEIHKSFGHCLSH